MAGANGTALDIHHIAVGVENLARMREFYESSLGFTTVVAEFRGVNAPIMAEVARSAALTFDGVILGHESGGILLELVQRTHPAARAIRADFTVGDIGLNGFVLEVGDGTPLASKSRTTRRDPEGNLIWIETVRPQPGIESRPGVRGVIIGVSDLARSASFYAGLLGFRPRGSSDEPEELTAESRDGRASRARVRSMRLNSSTQDSWIELIESVSPRGRSIPFATNWGDYGYLQTCFSCESASHVAAGLREAGITLLCAPHPAGPGPVETVGEFVYALDPDGAPVEFLHLPRS
jgi:catechol 2,3-dioxygenase-like lactoylglutathione lyase family enzyme